MKNHNQLELMLAIRRICGKAAAEGKTHMRAATLKKMDAQIRQLSKVHARTMTQQLAL